MVSGEGAWVIKTSGWKRVTHWRRISRVKVSTMAGSMREAVGMWERKTRKAAL